MFITCYVLYDAQDRHVATFRGPFRLAMFRELPDGCGIEEFLGDVSRGCVSLEYVKRHAAELANAA